MNKTRYRSHTCGELDKNHVGKEVTLCGWLNSLRVQGRIGFLSLRDRYGVTQFFLNPQLAKKFRHLKKESVLQIKGKVNARPANQVKKSMPTGEIEVEANEIIVLNESDVLPLDFETASEDTRLKYRYLDLRKPRMQKNIQLRYEIIKFIRQYLNQQNFVEITTPILTKSTPEGARDYIVPSRVHPGKFYALPQSPQQYKQLLMVAGFDRYFQIAPCFRDEDARAFRCPGEFYQLDLEMAFINREDILNLIEDLFVKLVKKVLPDKTLTFDKFPRLTYNETMSKYKTDSPDLRRNKKDKNELAFCWIIDFPLFAEQTKEDFFHGAGKKWAPSHHMFTMPKDEDIKYLNETDAGKVKSYQYDLVLNGHEVAGGSIRIHDPKIQEKIFDLIGFTKEQKKQFSHLLTAFKYGTPPHGGIAPGIDRIIAILLGEEHIRETIAFPKNKEVKDLVMDAPSEVEPGQLKELHIKTTK